MKHRVSELRVAYYMANAHNLRSYEQRLNQGLYNTMANGTFISDLYKDIESAGHTDIIIELVIRCEKCGLWMPDGLMSVTDDTAICDECE